MKGAAKCDKQSELQDSVNQQKFECALRFRVTPESMPVLVSTATYNQQQCPPVWAALLLCVFAHQSAERLCCKQRRRTHCSQQGIEYL